MTKQNMANLDKDKLIIKKFAHKLACNNTTIRLRTIKNIRKYLSSLSNDISEIYLLQLWKGLHYAMWMADKPLLQESLAEQICNLIPALKNLELSLKFFSAYLNLQVHEWMLIDQLRLDKFMMLVRVIFAKIFEQLRDSFWPQKNLDFLNETLLSCMNREDAPNSLLFHILQLFLPELEKHMDANFTKEKMLSIVLMFGQVIFVTKNKYLALEIKKQIIMKIIGVNSKFKIDNGIFVEFLLKMVNKKSCQNQNLIFSIIKLLKNEPIQKEKVNTKDAFKEMATKDDDIDENDINDAVKRLSKLDRKLRKKYLADSKKRKLAKYDSEEDDSDDDIVLDEAGENNDVDDDDDNENCSDMDISTNDTLNDSSSSEKLNSNEELKNNMNFPSHDEMKSLNVENDVNATHGSRLIVKNLNGALRIKKKKTGIKQKLKLKSPILRKKRRKVEISIEYEEDDLQNNSSVDMGSSLDKKQIKKVKFSSQNGSKEFRKNQNLTPKFDPNLLPMKSALKTTPSFRLNSTI